MCCSRAPQDGLQGAPPECTSGAHCRTVWSMASAGYLLPLSDRCNNTCSAPEQRTSHGDPKETNEFKPRKQKPHKSETRPSKFESQGKKAGQRGTKTYLAVLNNLSGSQECYVDDFPSVPWSNKLRRTHTSQTQNGTAISLLLRSHRLSNLQAKLAMLSTSCSLRYNVEVKPMMSWTSKQSSISLAFTESLAPKQIFSLPSNGCDSSN